MYFVLLCVIGILCEKMCIFIRQEIILTKDSYFNYISCLLVSFEFPVVPLIILF